MGSSQKQHNWREVKALELWFTKHQRDLPWRKTLDPYRIWISEVMLQQTQVAVVVPYYENFLAAFPTVHDLAQAKLEDVYAKWSGLGYYSRARNLKKGAEYLVAHHKGIFPKERETLLEVPGIGPYTAGAVLSIAYNLPVPLVDGNVMRVFARFFGFMQEIEERASQAFFWEKATEWAKSANSPRILNQAIMELGATICTKAQPSCPLCPLSKTCKAFAKNLQSQLPKRRARKKTKDLVWVKHIFEYQDTVFLKTNPKGEWWEGLEDFPGQQEPSVKTVLLKSVTLQKRMKAHQVKELDHQRHTVTHHKIHVIPLHFTFKKKPKLDNGQWHPKVTLENRPLSSLAKKITRALLD